jgi:hypothetical protein
MKLRACKLFEFKELQRCQEIVSRSRSWQLRKQRSREFAPERLTICKKSFRPLLAGRKKLFKTHLSGVRRNAPDSRAGRKEPFRIAG